MKVYRKKKKVLNVLIIKKIKERKKGKIYFCKLKKLIINY